MYILSISMLSFFFKLHCVKHWSMSILRQLWDRRSWKNTQTFIQNWSFWTYFSDLNMWVSHSNDADKQLCLTDQAKWDGQRPLFAEQAHGHSWLEVWCWSLWGVKRTFIRYFWISRNHFWISGIVILDIQKSILDIQN